MASIAAGAGPTGATRIAAVIGSPVRHSLSPAIYNSAFAEVGFDAVFGAFPVKPGQGGGAVTAMRTLGLMGLAVTMPHKADVAAAADRLDPAAAALGAANHLYWDGDEIVADNTDGEGFVRGLAAELGVQVTGVDVVLVGAGGSARSIAAALGAAGAGSVTVINRSADRAVECAGFAGPVGRVGSADDLAGADLVINATPIGMGSTRTAAETPFDVAAVGPDAVVADLIYHPAQTPLLAAAADRGLRHQNGVAMLVHQAVKQFENWTGLPAPVEAMTAAVNLGA